MRFAIGLGSHLLGGLAVGEKNRPISHQNISDVSLGEVEFESVISIHVQKHPHIFM